MFRRLRPTEWAFDIALAAFVGLVGLTFIVEPQHPVAGIAMVVLAAGAVALRRASPGLALGVTSASALLQMLSGAVPSPVNLSQLLVLYACAAFGSRLVRRIALAAAVAGAVVAAFYVRIVLVQPTWTGQVSDLVLIGLLFVFMLVVLACAWLLGLARHLVLRAREAAVAQRIAEVEAERERDRMEVELERGRVARDMHDVLAHSLVSIAMLADATRVAAQRDPGAAAELAGSIGDLARESVTDVRRLLAELRHGQAEGAAPTMADLPTLIGRIESLGLTVDRVDRGRPQPLSPGASLAVYRVVSECLTNALRHGDTGSPARLTFEWRPGALHIAVRNRVRTSVPDAVGASATSGTSGVSAEIPRGGHGLIGVRERVLLEAGTIDVRRDAAEFAVDVAIPTGHDALPSGVHPVTLSGAETAALPIAGPDAFGPGTITVHDGDGTDTVPRPDHDDTEDT